MKYLFYSLRPKHWIKNFFIFLPMIFGGRLFDLVTVLRTSAAFILFSVSASGVYLFNDISDLEKDKIHPTKKLRPIASGKVSVKGAFKLAVALSALSLPLSFLISPLFGSIVLAYSLFNIFYSKFLKDVVLIDIFCIAGFFLLRVLAGGIVSGVELSHWIIFMVGLLALFLGFNKRREELRLLKHDSENHRKVLSKYSVYFIDQMTAVITSSIVVVYMLYAVDSRTVQVFGTDHLIYTIPFVYYGIFRYLYIGHKLIKDGDPTRILLSDRPMQINIFLWLMVSIGVIYFRL